MGPSRLHHDGKEQSAMLWVRGGFMLPMLEKIQNAIRLGKIHKIRKSKYLQLCDDPNCVGFEDREPHKALSVRVRVRPAE